MSPLDDGCIEKGQTIKLLGGETIVSSRKSSEGFLEGMTGI